MQAWLLVYTFFFSSLPALLYDEHMIKANFYHDNDDNIVGKYSCAVFVERWYFYAVPFQLFFIVSFFPSVLSALQVTTTTTFHSTHFPYFLPNTTYISNDDDYASAKKDAALALLLF